MSKSKHVRILVDSVKDFALIPTNSRDFRKFRNFEDLRKIS